VSYPGADGRASAFAAKTLAACSLLALSLVCASAHADISSDLRVAVVIGNGAYAEAPLSNPVNDARAISGALKAAGFTVIEANDASREQMQAAIDRGAQLLQGHGGVGMLYYAGHGLQLDWHNYMVPVDARMRTAADVERQTIDVQSVLDTFKAAGNRMNIVVLDACRDNPFGAPSSARGLAPMEAPPRTLLAFATAPGNVAEDGSVAAGNGLYTRFLVREIGQPTATIEDVFKRVRLQVRQESEGRQVPWESTSLEEDFYFSPNGGTAASASTADKVSTFRVERTEWEGIKESKSPSDFYAFLQRHPNGAMSETAQAALDRLQGVSVRPEPGKDGVVSPQRGMPRYQVGDTFQYADFDFYGKERPPHRVVVTEVAGDVVVINGGAEVWDSLGNLIVDSNGRRSPAKMFFPSEMSVGKRWRSAYDIVGTGGKGSLYWDFKVVGIETVSVPAGRFQAYRVEGYSEVSTGARQSETYWVDPASFLMIKDEWVSRTGSNVNGSHRHELVSQTRTPR
jgi:hypothetical protein